jgi:hypothetical protein
MAHDELTAEKLLRFKDVASTWLVALGAASCALLLLALLS